MLPENESLNFEETITEIELQLQRAPERSSTVESINALHEKRKAAIAKLMKPEEARAIFLDTLIEAKESFERATLAVDIGDTYRREGTPESYEAAEKIFETVSTTIEKGNGFESTIVDINRYVAQALLYFSRDSKSQPNEAGMALLKEAANASIVLLESGKKDILSSEFGRNTLSRAITFLSSYAIRMGDMATFTESAANEKKYGLEPKNPHDKGNRVNSLAIAHLDMVKPEMSDEQKRDLLKNALQYASEADMCYLNAQSNAGYAAAILARLTKLRIFAAKFKYNLDRNLTQTYMEGELNTLGQYIAKYSQTVQPDALRGSFEILSKELEDSGCKHIRDELKTILNLQS